MYQSPTTPSNDVDGAPTGSSSNVTLVSFARAAAADAGAELAAEGAALAAGRSGAGGCNAVLDADDAAGGDVDRSQAPTSMIPTRIGLAQGFIERFSFG
jgi:hypothetical protein